LLLTSLPAPARAYEDQATLGLAVGYAGMPRSDALPVNGLDFALSELTTAGVSYSGQFGDGVSDNGVKGRFAWLF